MSRFVVSIAVDIQLRYQHAVEVLESLANGRVPFSETILYGSKLRDLTAPIGIDTKGLRVTILVKVGRVASLEAIIDRLIDRKSSLVPEPRILA